MEPSSDHRGVVSAPTLAKPNMWEEDMKATEFAEEVKRLATHPNITALHAMPACVGPDRLIDDDDCTVVKLYLEFTARKSDREDAPRGYPRFFYGTRDELHDVSALETRLHVYRTILEFLVRAERHEIREFLRLPDEDWAAPFHPHMRETASAYYSTPDLSKPLEVVDK